MTKPTREPDLGPDVAAQAAQGLADIGDAMRFLTTGDLSGMSPAEGLVVAISGHPTNDLSLADQVGSVAAALSDIAQAIRDLGDVIGGGRS